MLTSNLFRAGIVVLAAAIIFGAWAFAEYQGREDDAADRAVELGLDPLDELYEQARLAAESGETAAAVEMLERLLGENPDHAQAQALLRRLTAAGVAETVPDTDAGAPADSAPADTGDDGTTAPPGSENAYLNPADDLIAMLPAVISGWQRGTPVALGGNASVTFEPVGRSPVTRALFSVNDRETAKAAQAYVDGPIKRAYGKDGSNVKVGVAEGYSGTDGARVVAVAFARGRFACEVLVTVHEGAPVDSRNVAVELAREFEAAR